MLTIFLISPTTRHPRF